MILVLCGLPGSGKTTLSHQLSHQYNAKICNYDDFRQNYKNKNLKDFYHFVYKSALRQNVIVDTINLHQYGRLSLLKAIKDISKQKILIVMTTSVEECIKRNAQRFGQKNYVCESALYTLERHFQPPSLEEGWDEIHYI